MNLNKHRTKLIAARDEMNRTIAAIETVLAYTSTTKRGPYTKNSKKGDEKTGVKKSTLTKPLRPKKKVKTPKKIRHMSPEGEARRRAGYYAMVERRRKEREAQAKAPRKPAGRAQSVAA